MAAELNPGVNSSESSNGGWPNPIFQYPKNRKTQILPYSEYFKRRDKGRCYHVEGLWPGPEKGIRVTILVEDGQIKEERER